VIRWAREHGTGVIVYSPMGSGLLTGRFSRERAAGLDEGDWRRGSEQFNEPALTRNLELQDALRPVAERHDATPAAVAVAWTLHWPGVSGAIVGARSPEQVDGWIGAADLTLDDEDLRTLREAVGTTGAGAGPVAPTA
jgi:aryl-alcohol dehydrogenase-like predicted oxidoreductase